MSVDMFSTLNNDILQCILYEWLNIQDICQLDIAVCNHGIRRLYYEALQLSTLPLIKPFKKAWREKEFYNFLKWSKKREIKNPTRDLHLIQDQDEDRIIFEDYLILSENLKSFKYIESLFVNYWNPNLFYALSSLKCLTSISLTDIRKESNDFGVLGLFLKQLTSLESISFENCFVDPILLSFLSEIPSLKHLEIDRCTFPDEILIMLSKLAKLTKLESLKLVEDYIEDPLNLPFLSTFSHLTNLSLTNYIISLQDILSLTQLIELELNNIHVESNNINYENYLPLHQLESIVCRETNIDHHFILFILQSKQLEIFDFNFCSELQSSSFYEIGQLSKLTYLRLGNVLLDKQLFDNICKLSQLKSLNLPDFSKNINKQSFYVQFSKLGKQLTRLEFYNLPYEINKKTLEEISQLENLSELSFDWDSNDFKELKPLSQLKRLTVLNINKRFCNSQKNKFIKQIKQILHIPGLWIRFNFPF